MDYYLSRHVLSVMEKTNAITFDDSEVPVRILGEGRIEDADVPLVVRMDIANYKMIKILVDTGSSGNIILFSTLKQLSLENMALESVTTWLIRFGGSEVSP